MHASHGPEGTGCRVMGAGAGGDGTPGGAGRALYLGNEAILEIFPGGEYSQDPYESIGETKIGRAHV